VREQILESVLEREGRMSTGIGQGIAIPDGKCALVEGIEIAFGLAQPPIEFDSLDGEPVRIFFLLVSPPELTGPHIQALAQISRMLSADSVRDDLLLAESAERVLALLAAGESGS
jgi:mannitol/fructose-specific phosphotransferase system IIA component (Ntr-type)